MEEERSEVARKKKDQNMQGGKNIGRCEKEEKLKNARWEKD